MLARLLLLLALMVGPLPLAAPAGAADPTPTGPPPTHVALTATPAYADLAASLHVVVTADDGTPLAGVVVRLERRVDGAWQPLAELTTDDRGAAAGELVLARDADDNLVRALVDGTDTRAPGESAPVLVPLLRRDSVVRLRGPDEVVDEQTVTLRVRWRTASGVPVAGEVRLLRRKGDRWPVVRTLRTGADGLATVTLRPRTDSRWRVRASRLDWVSGDRSGTHRIDNLPPGAPVRLPDGAPRPSVRLPAQPRAAGAGPNAVTSRIPDGVWAQMTGVSWHRGCPVGRAGLRLVRVNYWAYDGYRRRGEVVVHADAAGRVSAALQAMYHQRLPIRSMYRIDRFGWSDRLRGGDDYRSMAAGNTSGFNCRDVVGRPGVRSPHSWGRAIDVNPWENPYRTGSAWLPNGWWVGRSHPRVAWRTTDHPVVRLMAAHGLRWTYGTRDAHHFDAR